MADIAWAPAPIPHPKTSRNGRACNCNLFPGLHPECHHQPLTEPNNLPCCTLNHTGMQRRRELPVPWTRCPEYSSRKARMATRAGELAALPLPGPISHEPRSSPCRPTSAMSHGYARRAARSIPKPLAFTLSSSPTIGDPPFAMWNSAHTSGADLLQAENSHDLLSSTSTCDCWALFDSHVGSSRFSQRSGNERDPSGVIQGNTLGHDSSLRTINQEISDTVEKHLR